MQAARQIETGGGTITIRELIVGDVRAWVRELSDQTVPATDWVGALVGEDDCTLADLQRLSDATLEQLDACTAADLAALTTAARALNPHFFRVRVIVAEAYRSSLTSLTAPSVGS